MISILYVDDEPDLLMLAKKFLERSGEFTVETCNSALEALVRLNSDSYDAIISDYQMPGMDGIEFLKQIRTQYGDIPFILFTGRGREEVVIQAIDNGVDFYLQKGGDPRSQFAELSHKLKKSIERNQAIHALAKSEERMRLALNGANEGSWDIDLISGEFYMNPRGWEMLGYTIEEIQQYASINWRNLVHPDDLPTSMAALYAHYQGDSNFFQFEERLLMKSGEWKWVLSRGKVFKRDKQGLAVRIAGTHTDITEQKRAEADLRDKTDYLNLIFSSVREGIVIIDAKTHEILDINPAAATMIGADKDQILHRICHSYICPTELGSCPITDLHQTVDNSERFLITADGTRISIIKYVVPFTFQGRECLLETFFNNNERKRAQEELLAAYEQIAAAEEELRSQLFELAQLQEALQISEIKFRTIIETIPDVIWDIKPDGSFSYVSPRSVDMFGFPPEELIGRSVLTILSPEGQIKMKSVLEKELSKIKGLLSFDVEARHKDGSLLVLNIRSYPLLDDKGNLVGLRGVTTDVTERTEFISALRKRDAILESVSKAVTILMHQLSSPDFQIIFGILGEILSVSRVYIRVPSDKLGELSEEPRYQPWVSVDDSVQYRPFIQFYTEWGPDLSRWLFLLKNGEYIAGSINSFPSGECEFLNTCGIKSLAIFPIFRKSDLFGILVFEDKLNPRDWIAPECKALMTAAALIGSTIERLEVEALNESYTTQITQKSHELALMNVDLQERSYLIERFLERKNELITQIGHDLRTPLTPIIGLLPLLKNGVTDPELLTTIETIGAGAHRIKLLLDKILLLRQMQTPEEDEEYGYTDIHSLVEKILVKYLDEIHLKEINFINTIPTPLFVQIPDKSLYLVLEELMSNAIRFTQDRGKIEFNAESQESTVTISISDSGIGLRDEDKERIFDYFYKADHSRHSIDTHGLGLPIVKQIIDKYQGTIMVISDGPGNGTTLSFTLPIRN
ncbi:MAG TPA: PAS domain S-box protein [Methanospirillum sp.]|nr:PAS domain S-box protein [Methanospirillum sp.]